VGGVAVELFARRTGFAAHTSPVFHLVMVSYL